VIPDMFRALESGVPVRIRKPHAIRPWQHVLEPLSGYMLLAQHLYEKGQAVAEGWNFGPVDEDSRPVSWIVEKVCEQWGNGSSWQCVDDGGPHEANFLKLDISKARSRLGWLPKWNLVKGLQKTTAWHRAWMNGQNMRDFSLAQIAEFQSEQDTATAH